MIKITFLPHRNSYLGCQMSDPDKTSLFPPVNYSLIGNRIPRLSSLLHLSYPGIALRGYLFHSQADCGQDGVKPGPQQAYVNQLSSRRKPVPAAAALPERMGMRSVVVLPISKKRQLPASCSRKAAEADQFSAASSRGSVEPNPPVPQKYAGT